MSHIHIYIYTLYYAIVIANDNSTIEKCVVVVFFLLSRVCVNVWFKIKRHSLCRHFLLPSTITKKKNESAEKRNKTDEKKKKKSNQIETTMRMIQYIGVCCIYISYIEIHIEFARKIVDVLVAKQEFKFSRRWLWLWICRFVSRGSKFICHRSRECCEEDIIW